MALKMAVFGETKSGTSLQSAGTWMARHSFICPEARVQPWRSEARGQVIDELVRSEISFWRLEGAYRLWRQEKRGPLKVFNHMSAVGNTPTADRQES